MTISEAIADARKVLEEVSATSDFTDSFIWRMYSTAKARVYRNQEGKRQYISAWAKHRFCIQLEKVKSHDCECVAVGCDVLRTVHKVPKPLTGRMSDVIEVLTLSGKQLGFRTEAEVKSDLLDDVKKKEPSFGVYNQYLYIWNNLNLKAIQLNAPWDNIVDWQEIQYCDDNTSECVDVYSLETGVGLEQHEDILKIIPEILKYSLQIPDDRVSDRNPDIKL